MTVKPGVSDGTWSMALSFFHLPSVAVRKAALMGSGSIELSAKFSYYGMSALVIEGMDIQAVYLYEDAIKAFTDQAVDLTFHHPEMLLLILWF